MSSRNILVVDDDASMRDNLWDILTDEGYETFSAATCSEAVDKAQQMEFQTAILDLKLPDGVNEYKLLF